MKKNIAGLGIEPQTFKMSYFETWCPLDHKISDRFGFNYLYINTVISMWNPLK